MSLCGFCAWTILLKANWPKQKQALANQTILKSRKVNEFQACVNWEMLLIELIPGIDVCLLI